MSVPLETRVAEAFSAGGALAAAIPGFEARPGQKALAVAWARALSREAILVAEAGTGIGKTIAYLVPAILSGRKTVVSTATRALQQQVAENDIPLVRRALGLPISCAVVKGRANYLCRRRWTRFAAEPLFEFAGEARHFARMREFAETTRTGDLSECPGIPEDFRAWSEVDARSEMCDAADCAEADACFLAEIRRQAAAADVVVVNHHLFHADLALRARRGTAARGSDGDGADTGLPVVPRGDAIVLDEAHGIEEAASAFFGVSVSLARARELLRDLRRACARRGLDWSSVPAAVDGFREAAEALFGEAGTEEGRVLLPPPGARFSARAESTLQAAEELADRLSLVPGSAGREAEAGALLRRVRAFASDLDAVRSADPPEAVGWAERRGPSIILHRTPVAVAPVLADALWLSGVPILLASATLSVAGDLSYFRRRVGLGDVDAAEIIVDNDFDSAGRAMVYVPRGVPDPADEGFAAAAARETADILSLSGGGALVLCTSYRTLGALRESLRGAVPYPVFVQGEAPRTHLLRAFREDGDAVLIGTGTFWEGIDVPGPPLRCVVIDKLPFAPPGDPVVTARMRAIERRGDDPFTEFQLPEAVLALRQGVGRLLRRADDYGVVVLLDRRVMTRRYGAAFRESLPAMPWVRDREAVARFFERFRPGEGREDGEGGR